MTIREYLSDYLANRGLFADEAAKVIEAYKDRETSISSRMNDDIFTDYPPEFIKVLIVTIRGEAVDWIDKNKPKHWARGMFIDEPPTSLSKGK